MKTTFYPRGLTNRLIELQEHISIVNSSLIIILDIKDYKIIRSEKSSTQIVRELEESSKISAKDDFIVDKHGDSVWISTSEPNDDLYIRNVQTENNIKSFLENNNLTKEELINLLEEM